MNRMRITVTTTKSAWQARVVEASRAWVLLTSEGKAISAAVVDGGAVLDRVLEGVLFDVQPTVDGFVVSSRAQDHEYLDNFNMPMIITDVAKYVADLDEFDNGEYWQ